MVFLLLLSLESCLLVRVYKLPMLWVLLEIVLLCLLDALNLPSKSDQLVLLRRRERPFPLGIRQTADFGFETW